MESGVALELCWVAAGLTLGSIFTASREKMNKRKGEKSVVAYLLPGQIVGCKLNLAHTASAQRLCEGIVPENTPLCSI